MLPRKSFSRLLATYLGSSALGTIEKIIELSEDVAGGQRSSEALLDFYGLYCGRGADKKLKRLFFTAFRDEAETRQDEVFVVEHLWEVPLERAVKVVWLAELLSSRDEEGITALIRQALHPQDAVELADTAALTQEVISAIKGDTKES